MFVVAIKVINYISKFNKYNFFILRKKKLLF